MVPVGKVYLVGAGPGDPGLLTLKGRECLQRADLVLYDGLVNPLLLRDLPAKAARTCRAHGPGGQSFTQDEINAQLIAAALSGQTVVRLKGGDPFVFGRGSEEASALARAGIPYEIVPGVTAATAAAEYAGFSLTHRDYASTVVFAAGHEDPAKGAPVVDYDQLAAIHGTLVFYMGLRRMETIVDSLIAAGKDPTTPACAISRASTAQQRTIVAPLGELAAKVREAALESPTLIVVGQCVEQRKELAWFERLPLFGQSIGITRPAGQAGNAIERAVSLGAEPVLLPTIEIRPPKDWSDVDRALAKIDAYDWLVFTSANGVENLLGRLWETGGDGRRLGRLRIAAIGPATAEALEAFRLRADVVPEAYRAEELASALASHVAGKRVLWARASRGRDVLPAELEKAGATVDQVVTYDHVDVTEFSPAIIERLKEGRLDWIALSSPAIARSLKALLPAESLPHLGSRIKLAAISPVTAAAAKEAGLPISAVATTYTWDGLFDAIVAAESDATRQRGEG